MDCVMINGQAVEVPDDVRKAALSPTDPDYKEHVKRWGAGPEAFERWFAEQDAPHAAAALAKSGLKKGEVTCTGFGGAMLTADVERAIVAKKDAEKNTPAPAPAPVDGEPKES